MNPENFNKYFEDQIELALKARNYSIKVLGQISQLDIKQIEVFIDNRDRIFKILHKMQIALEAEINRLKPLLSSSEKQYIIDWSIRFEKITLDIERLDSLIIEELEGFKSQIANEVSDAFKNKSKLKGYDLYDLKR